MSHIEELLNNWKYHLQKEDQAKAERRREILTALVKQDFSETPDDVLNQCCIIMGKTDKVDKLAEALKREFTVYRSELLCMDVIVTRVEDSAVFPVFPVEKVNVNFSVKLPEDVDVRRPAMDSNRIYRNKITDGRLDHWYSKDDELLDQLAQNRLEVQEDPYGAPK